MLLTSTIVLLSLASQLSPAPLDPPIKPQAASAQNSHQEAAEPPAPTEPVDSVEAQAVSPSTSHQSTSQPSGSAMRLDAPPEIPPLPSSVPADVKSLDATAGNSPDKDGTPHPNLIDANEADTEPPPASASAVDPNPLALSICQAHAQAQALRYAGMGVGIAGVTGAAAFAAISLYERGQAQDLLDSSPAFGKVGDTYVQRDASHADVASYLSHRDTASVMGQLGWVALGASASGLSAMLTAGWLDAQLEDCPSGAN